MKTTIKIIKKEFIFSRQPFSNVSLQIKFPKIII